MSLRRRRQAGFTLIEAIAALALTATLLLALSAITGQWLPSWRHGFGRLQTVEALDLGLDRLAADIAAARFVTSGGIDEPPLFFGEPTRIAFVRPEIGPNAKARLEWVRIEQIASGNGPLVVRSRAPYAPASADAAPPQFADATSVLKAPWRIRFAFAGGDGVWRDDWVGKMRPPSAVRIDVRNASNDGPSAFSTVAPLAVDAPAACVGKVSIERCFSDLALGTP